MKTLSEKQITQKRHELFADFARRALSETEDGALACKYAETALKALSTPEHDAVAPVQATGVNVERNFEQDLQRAYA